MVVSSLINLTKPDPKSFIFSFFKERCHLRFCFFCGGECQALKWRPPVSGSLFLIAICLRTSNRVEFSEIDWCSFLVIDFVIDLINQEISMRCLKNSFFLSDDTSANFSVLPFPAWLTMIPSPHIGACQGSGI